jgi:hypothetical protein
MKQPKTSSASECKNSINLTKRVKNGQMIKQGVSENEFVKMVKTGSIEQLQSLQQENIKLKEALADMAKRIREMVNANVTEPIKKSNPVFYTELRQILDPEHCDMERNGFVTFL